MKSKIFLLITTLFFLFGCAKKESQLTLQGSTTLLPLAQKIAEFYIKENPQVNISIRGGGSGNGIASLLEKTVDIAISSREIKPEELAIAKEKGVNPIAHIIAYDGIGVIIHPQNPVNNLTLEELKDIYTGKIRNWAEVGGPGSEIVVVSRDSASGTYEVFNNFVLGEEKLTLQSLMESSNQLVLNIIATTQGGIGYVGLGYIKDNNKVKPVSINGVYPSKENIIEKKYLLIRPLYMYTDGEPQGDAKDFLSFIFSTQGKKLVEKEGFVPTI